MGNYPAQPKAHSWQRKTHSQLKIKKKREINVSGRLFTRKGSYTVMRLYQHQFQQDTRNMNYSCLPGIHKLKLTIFSKYHLTDYNYCMITVLLQY